MTQQTRNPLQKTVKFDPVTVGPDFTRSPAIWLANQAATHHLNYLLAYADDGVIWGEVRDEGLALSGEAFADYSPPLKLVTLQHARLFGPEAEVLLWRTEDGFAARLLTEIDSDQTSCLEEQYLLWGTATANEESHNGFFLLAEGKQGLRHSPPIKPISKNGKEIERLSLTVRHYLDHDDDGQTYIKVSRLVTLNNGGENG